MRAQLAIDRVGIKACAIRSGSHRRRRRRAAHHRDVQHVRALPHDFKGTHMSRFVEIIDELSANRCRSLALPACCDELVQRLEAPRPAASK